MKEQLSESRINYLLEHLGHHARIPEDLSSRFRFGATPEEGKAYIELTKEIGKQHGKVKRNDKLREAGEIVTYGRGDDKKPMSETYQAWKPPAERLPANNEL